MSNDIEVMEEVSRVLSIITRNPPNRTYRGELRSSYLESRAKLLEMKIVQIKDDLDAWIKDLDKDHADPAYEEVVEFRDRVLSIWKSCHKTYGE